MAPNFPQCPSELPTTWPSSSSASSFSIRLRNASKSKRAFRPARSLAPRSPGEMSRGRFSQCDISTGTVIDRKMLRVTPPSTNSRKRAWP